MDISIVIPAYNESESIPELIKWINEIMNKNPYTYEIIFIDDGSSDNTWEVLKEYKKKIITIKALKFLRNYGKAAALHVGFKAASGNVVITMDADLQDSPEEIPSLYKMIIEEDYDLVSGWKKKRKDPVLSKNIPSKFYNWTVRRMSGIQLHDFNCGLKAYKKRVIKSIELCGEMHRYIPVLAKWAGFKKIGEKTVHHQERKYGITKYGMQRFIRGPLDLLTIMFITRYGRRPLHLFGSIGTIMFLIGFSMALFLGIEKLVAISHHIVAPLVTRSPYFFIALTSMILGTQLFLSGFLGEMISRNSNDSNTYQIEEEL